MAGVEREEFREFVAYMRKEMSEMRGEVGEHGKMLAVLMDARERVGSEMPDAGNFNIKRIHVVIFVGTVVAVIGALKLLKVIP